MKAAYGALLLLTVGVLVRVLLAPATGAELSSRSLTLSSSIATTTAPQLLTFNITTPDTLGSILVQYCSNSPFTDVACDAPSGLDASATALSAQTGQTGFNIDAASTTANQILLTRTPAPSVAGQASYTFSAVTNPDTAGSYFMRIQTFASPDVTGPATDYGAVVFAINAEVSVSAEVPPYLIFCTATSIPTFNCDSADGDNINFGELSSVRAIQGTSQLMAATNAENGYNIAISGTTLTSGNNVINALAPADVSRPGNSQFGLNLRANSAPAGGNEPAGPGVAMPLPLYAQANFFRFVPNDAIVSTDVPDDMRRFTASYLVNIPRGQAPGVYVSTITYVAFGNF